MTEQLSTAQHVMATASPVVNNLPAAQELQNPPSSILGQEDPLKEGVATHSRIPAWRIPWTEEPGRLQSLGSQRVKHNRSDLAAAAAVITKGLPR